MVVVQIIDKFRFGGGENVARNYSKILNLLGIENYIAASKIENEEFINTLKTENIHYVFLKDIFEIVRDFDKNDIRIIIHTNRGLMFFIRHLSDFIEKEHSYYIQHLNYNSIKFWLLSKILNKKLGNFIQISPRLDRLVRHFIKIKVWTVPNFHVRKYSKSEYSAIRRNVREILSCNSDDYLITFISIFRRGKGLEDFLSLMRDFRDPKAKFLIVGDGPLRKLLKDLSSENAKWIGLQRDTEKFLIASDLYIFPSHLPEMLPLSVVEAMTVDRPVIAYENVSTRFLLPEELLVRNLSDLRKRAHQFAKNEVRAWKYKRVFDEEYGVKALKTILRVQEMRKGVLRK